MGLLSWAGGMGRSSDRDGARGAPPASDPSPTGTRQKRKTSRRRNKRRHSSGDRPADQQAQAQAQVKVRSDVKQNDPIPDTAGTHRDLPSQPSKAATFVSVAASRINIHWRRATLVCGVAITIVAIAATLFHTLVPEPGMLERKTFPFIDQTSDQPYFNNMRINAIPTSSTQCSRLGSERDPFFAKFGGTACAGFRFLPQQHPQSQDADSSLVNERPDMAEIFAVMKEFSSDRHAQDYAEKIWGIHSYGPIKTSYFEDITLSVAHSASLADVRVLLWDPHQHASHLHMMSVGFFSGEHHSSDMFNAKLFSIVFRVDNIFVFMHLRAWAQDAAPLLGADDAVEYAEVLADIILARKRAPANSLERTNDTIMEYLSRALAAAMAEGSLLSQLLHHGRQLASAVAVFLVAAVIITLVSTLPSPAVARMQQRRKRRELDRTVQSDDDIDDDAADNAQDEPKEKERAESHEAQDGVNSHSSSVETRASAMKKRIPNTRNQQCSNSNNSSSSNRRVSGTVYPDVSNNISRSEPAAKQSTEKSACSAEPARQNIFPGDDTHTKLAQSANAEQSGRALFHRTCEPHPSPSAEPRDKNKKFTPPSRQGGPQQASPQTQMGGTLDAKKTLSSANGLELEHQLGAFIARGKQPEKRGRGLETVLSCPSSLASLLAEQSAQLPTIATATASDASPSAILHDTQRSPASSTSLSPRPPHQFLHTVGNPGMFFIHGSALQANAIPSLVNPVPHQPAEATFFDSQPQQPPPSPLNPDAEEFIPASHVHKKPEPPTSRPSNGKSRPRRASLPAYQDASGSTFFLAPSVSNSSSSSSPTSPPRQHATGVAVPATSRQPSRARSSSHPASPLRHGLQPRKGPQRPEHRHTNVVNSSTPLGSPGGPFPNVGYAYYFDVDMAFDRLEMGDAAHILHTNPFPPSHPASRTGSMSSSPRTAPSSPARQETQGRSSGSTRQEPQVAWPPLLPTPFPSSTGSGPWQELRDGSDGLHGDGDTPLLSPLAAILPPPPFPIADLTAYEHVLSMQRSPFDLGCRLPVYANSAATTMEYHPPPTSEYDTQAYQPLPHDVMHASVSTHVEDTARYTGAPFHASSDAALYPPEMVEMGDALGADVYLQPAYFANAQAGFSSQATSRPASSASFYSDYSTPPSPMPLTHPSSGFFYPFDFPDATTAHHDQASTTATNAAPKRSSRNQQRNRSRSRSRSSSRSSRNGRNNDRSSRPHKGAPNHAKSHGISESSSVRSSSSASHHGMRGRPSPSGRDSTMPRRGSSDADCNRQHDSRKEEGDDASWHSAGNLRKGHRRNRRRSGK